MHVILDRVDPKWHPYKRRKDPETLGGEGHAKRQAETGVMELRAEELGGSWLHQKLKERPGRVSSSESSWFQVSGL